MSQPPLIRVFVTSDITITVPLEEGESGIQFRQRVCEKAAKKFARSTDNVGNFVFYIENSKFLIDPTDAPICGLSLLATTQSMKLVDRKEALKRKMKKLNERAVLCFSVQKKNPHSGSWQTRVLHFDLADEVFHNVERGNINRTFTFDHLVNFSRGDDLRSFVIGSSKTAPYECVGQADGDAEEIEFIMRKVLTRGSKDWIDEYNRDVLISGNMEVQTIQGSSKGGWTKRFLIIVGKRVFAYKDSLGSIHPKEVYSFDFRKDAANGCGVFFDGKILSIRYGEAHNVNIRATSKEDINTWRSAFLEAVNTSSIVSIIKIKEEVAEGKAIEESLKQENHGEVVERRGKDAELKARRTTVRMQRSVLNLKVFYCFSVHEGIGHVDGKHLQGIGIYKEVIPYILHFDFEAEKLGFIVKEKLKKTVPFETIANFSADKDQSRKFTIVFTTQEKREFVAEIQEERDIICALLFRVLNEDYRGLNANEPRQLIKAGYIDRKEKGVWAQRYVMLVPWKIFIFKGASGVHFPRQVISLYRANIRITGNVFDITEGDSKLLMRASVEGTRDGWLDSIREATMMDEEEQQMAGAGAGATIIDTSEERAENGDESDSMLTETVVIRESSRETDPARRSTREDKPAGEEEPAECESKAVTATESESETETETETKAESSEPAASEERSDKAEDVQAIVQNEQETPATTETRSVEEQNEEISEKEVSNEGEEKREEQIEEAQIEARNPEDSVGAEEESTVDTGENIASKSTERSEEGEGAVEPATDRSEAVEEIQSEAPVKNSSEEPQRTFDEEVSSSEDEREDDDEGRDRSTDAESEASFSLVQAQVEMLMDEPEGEVVKSIYISALKMWRPEFSEKVRKLRSFWQELEKSTK